MEGQSIKGRYRVSASIGVGGQGRVFRGWDELLRTRVAIKIADSRDEGSVRRLVREATIGAAIGSGPGFVRVIDFGRTPEELPFLVMDYVPRARSLRATGRPISVPIWASCCRLVSRVHKAGIVHRDLKPGNFLLSQPRQTGGPELYLVDFGLAKRLGPESSSLEVDLDLTSTDTALGTLVFTAPEQLRDAASADFRSDVYSLGVMLFVALTGALPYGEAASLLDLVEAHELVRAGRASAPSVRDVAVHSDVSERILDLCDACTAVDPSARPDSANEILHGGYESSSADRPGRMMLRRGPLPGGSRGISSSDVDELLDEP